MEAVICPRCHDKLKDMDVVLKQDCSKRTEASHDKDIVSKRKFYSSPGKNRTLIMMEVSLRELLYAR
ncbi:hypothetical protein TNCT_473051 [Trichonephila clavata]|uniref:Uncharacterized protein n=1 Tax=Trichonephila clavata TaxID=2740835 RepID=A0A8X6LI39_TRICU|nr:hypothetical protein TNCT_473051 [Trichonephila clavata]